MRIRSLLYAPGNRPDLMEKVGRSGADAVILDLEDAVPPAEKARACAIVGAYLKAGPPLAAFVRLNSGRAGLEDLARLSLTGVSGVLIPKADDPALLADIDRALTSADCDAAIQPLIETVAGLYGMDALAAASPRVRRVSFGAGDFTRDLRAQATEARTETLYARQHIVARSRYLGLDTPIAHVFSRIRDLNGLHRACVEDRALGFGARSCIHPSQVPVINAAFAPTDAEIDQAHRIRAAYAEAKAAGRGSLLLDDGTFIDEAVDLRAQDLLQAES